MRNITYGELVLSSDIVPFVKVNNCLRKGLLCIVFNTNIFGEHSYTLEFAEVEYAQQIKNLRSDTPMVIYLLGCAIYKTPMDAFNSALKWCGIERTPENGVWRRMKKEEVFLAAERYRLLHTAAQIV